MAEVPEVNAITLDRLVPASMVLPVPAVVKELLTVPPVVAMVNWSLGCARVPFKIFWLINLGGDRQKKKSL